MHTLRGGQGRQPSGWLASRGHSAVVSRSVRFEWAWYGLLFSGLDPRGIPLSFLQCVASDCKCHALASGWIVSQGRSAVVPHAYASGWARWVAFRVVRAVCVPGGRFWRPCPRLSLSSDKPSHAHLLRRMRREAIVSFTLKQINLGLAGHFPPFGQKLRQSLRSRYTGNDMACKTEYASAGPIDLQPAPPAGSTSLIDKRYPATRPESR